jgi:hypothetical protein
LRSSCKSKKKDRKTAQAQRAKKKQKQKQINNSQKNPSGMPGGVFLNDNGFFNDNGVLFY